MDEIKIVPRFEQAQHVSAFCNKIPDFSSKLIRILSILSYYLHINAARGGGGVCQKRADACRGEGGCLGPWVRTQKAFNIALMWYNHPLFSSIKKVCIAICCITIALGDKAYFWKANKNVWICINNIWKLLKSTQFLHTCIFLVKNTTTPSHLFYQLCHSTLLKDHFIVYLWV